MRTTACVRRSTTLRQQEGGGKEGRQGWARTLEEQTPCVWLLANSSSIVVLSSTPVCGCLMIVACTLGGVRSLLLARQHPQHQWAQEQEGAQTLTEDPRRASPSAR